MPDIDMDFDDERRGEVIEYVRDKYGDDKVAQIITFGTMKARAAVRDAGRVLGYPYGVPDKITKMIQARTSTPRIDGLARRTNPELQGRLRDRTPTPSASSTRPCALEGIVRGEGVHAAGVVICRDPLHYHVPVKCDTKGGAVITQYDGPTVADLGLLKMDFLGLRTLTVIADARRERSSANHGVDIDIDDIPLDDAETFALLQRGDTDGVFQVESPGMRSVLKHLKPTVVRRHRRRRGAVPPGPAGLGMVDDFVDAQARPHADHATTTTASSPSSRRRTARIVYQEQVMRISMEMAGFSAAKADKLRKAHGQEGSTRSSTRSSPSSSTARVEQRLRPRKLAEQHVDRHREVRRVRVQQEPRGGLRRSSRTRPRTSRRTTRSSTWRRCSRATPARPTRSSSTSPRATAAGITVLPPDVNSSGKDFTRCRRGHPLRARGHPRCRARAWSTRSSPSATRAGRSRRCRTSATASTCRQVNKKTLEALIKAGAFDSTGYTRKHLMSMMDGVRRRRPRSAQKDARLRPGLDVRHVRRGRPRLLRRGRRRPTATSGTRR